MSTKTTYGVTEVKIGDEQYSLNICLGAVRAISAKFGGLSGMRDTVAAHNIDGMAFIVAAGSQPVATWEKPVGEQLSIIGKQAEALADEVFIAGPFAVGLQLIPYVGAVLNPKGEAAGNAPKKSAARATQ